jgi:ABC-type uncharacterized transport system ATPase subunit
MRYALTKIPFDFSHVGFMPTREVVKAKSLSPHEIALVERNKDRIRMLTSGQKIEDGANEEITAWNEVIGVDLSDYEDFF